MEINDTNEILDALNNLKPEFTVKKVTDIFNQRLEVKNTELYEIVQKLTGSLKPYSSTEYDTRWVYLYLPMKEEDDKIICGNFSISLDYKKRYYIRSMFAHGGLLIDKGEEAIDPTYKTILSEMDIFLPPVLKYREKLLEVSFPYSWHTGKIARKYIKSKSELISVEAGNLIIEKYKQHIDKNLKIHKVSVNEYLETAAICYKAAFTDQIKEYQKRKRLPEHPTTKELHQGWADERHGGMFDLSDWNNQDAFMEWYESKKWEGAHPFEIVYSTPHGIYLYPPGLKREVYYVSVSDHYYNPHYLKMVEALIDAGVPFKASDLENIVNYCTGEIKIDVNSGSYYDETLRYQDILEEREKYFQYIEWDKYIIPEGI